VDEPEALAWRLTPEWALAHDPYLMEGMGRACVRIRQAVEAREPILIYGDYDVDGVTATAVLFRTLERLGAVVDFFIPDRFNDGYGLHLDCIQALVQQGARLVISVDCGVRSLKEVQAGRELGLDWIITDHHALGEALPEATAVLHPRVGSYPNPNLSGVGVAFKLAQALLDAVPIPRGEDARYLDGLLKLVALGTIADMVPLEGENALLVRRGLDALGGTHGPGLTALMRACRLEGVPRAQEIAFGPAPRLNAAGRMGGAGDAVRLLLTRDTQEARRLADDIEARNQERRQIQAQVLEALDPPDGSPFDLVVHPDTHKGVMGIVAAQRMRRTGLPTGVGTLIDQVAHCSLRAPAGYSCLELLEAARPFLLSGGGHDAAAGITFAWKHREFVHRALNVTAQTQCGLREAHPVAVDGLGAELLPGTEELRRLEPFGVGFPEPMVILEGQLEAPPRAFGQGHLKFRLEPHADEVVWFSGAAEAALPLHRRVRCAATPSDHPRFGRSWRLETLVGEARP